MKRPKTGECLKCTTSNSKGTDKQKLPKNEGKVIGMHSLKAWGLLNVRIQLE